MSSKENLKSFGPLRIKEEGDYGTVSAFGPCKATVPFSADVIKVQGPFVANDDVSADVIKVNGPAVIEGVANFDKLKFNGPGTIRGRLEVNEKASVNGPLTVDESITGTSETLVKINGPLKTTHLSDADKVTINGPVNVETIQNVKTLKIKGQTRADSIQVDEKVSIDLKINVSEIKSIKAKNVEIGQNLTSPGGKGFLGKVFRGAFDRSTGTAVIDEIHATGTVELDNVTVNKIIAKEVFAGDNTEIGEFIEITEEE
ncbi:MAG: hypothetical protein ACXAC7_22145 [Candidatus Hodarchaeales archaeon]|jgi:hypothetical protein